MIWTQNDTRLMVELEDTRLGFACVDGELLGLAEVTVGGTALRSGATLLQPWLQSVKGMQYERFMLDGVRVAADGTLEIATRAHGRPQFESVYGDQYMDRQFMVSAAVGPVVDRLTWLIRPAALTLDGLAYGGFSYAWRFESATETVHRLICKGTWEIGGRATGNTVLSQGQVTPAVYSATVENHFTSACLQSLKRFGDPTAMSFQFVPRWGAQQCFDFLAHAAGSLLGYWPGKHDTRSFLQKNPGEDVLFVVDAMHWQATGSVETPRKCVVFAPADGAGDGEAGMPEHVARNRWYAANEHCTGVVRGLYGITRSRPLPERMVGYGQRLQDDGRFELRVGEQWVAAQDWLRTIADTLLPKYAEMGVRRVITEPIVQSDPTERGMLRKLGALGLHGDMNIGSVCCVHRYQPAALFGGVPAWRYFCDRAHELGLEVGHWIGPHLAYNAPILKEHPEWMLKGFSSIVQSGGYPNYMLACLNWNTPVRQWILDDLRRLRDDGGLDYVWFDSLANLGMLPIDFAKAMETNTDALLGFMADLQREGIGHIAVEGMAAAAMSGAHIMDHEPDHDGGVQWIAGQNSWLWYEGNEDMLIGQQPRTWVHKSRSAENVEQRFFRCLANRCLPELPGGRYGAFYGTLIAAYLAVEPALQHRRLLPARQGVVWTAGAADGGGVEVVFAFTGFEHAMAPGATASRWVDDRFVALGDRGLLRTEPYTIYRIA